MTSSVRPSAPPTRSGGTDGLPSPVQLARSGLVSLAALPGQGVRKVIRSSGTTPGQLLLIAVSLVTLSLLVGLAGAAMADSKSDTMTNLTDRREPFAAAAQHVYRSLSDADATAAIGFLSTGDEPRRLRERYADDIAQATTFLAKAAADTGSVRTARQVEIIAQQLPVYTGLIETARANNRQGFPTGASYLREASHLMRSTILPAAEELYQIDNQRLTAEQDDANGFPWFTTLLVIGLLAALVVAQRFITRKSNRAFNIGLVVATAAVLFGVLWSALALIVQAVLISSSQSDGTEQVYVLSKARIAALKARADETLTLVARGGGAFYEQEFRSLFAELGGDDGTRGLLGRAESNPDVDGAKDSAQSWLTAHAAVRKADEGGAYAEAVRLAVSEKVDGGAAAAFKRLDGRLHEAINVGRQSFFDDTVNASRALTLLPAGWALIGVVAALGVTVGIRERLREYQ